MSGIFVKVVSNPGAFGKVHWYAMKVSTDGSTFLGWGRANGTFTAGVNQSQEYQDRDILPAPYAGDAIEMAESFGWTVLNKQALANER